MAVIIQYLYTLNVELLTMAIMIIAIGPSLVLISMTKDLKHSLHTLDNSTMTKEHHLEIIHQFNDFVQFHANAKELSQ